jgi:hypothetical protein
LVLEAFSYSSAIFCAFFLLVSLVEILLHGVLISDQRHDVSRVPEQACAQRAGAIGACEAAPKMTTGKE